MNLKEIKLTHEDEIELTKIVKYSNDDVEKQRAIEKLIFGNMRLIKTIARKYSKSTPHYFDDLVQEGVIGLQLAITKYNEESGFRFSTYMAWWIRQAIQSYLYHNRRTVRIPNYLTNQQNKIQKAKQDFHNEFGAEPTDDELAELVELSNKKIRTIQRSNQHISSLDFQLDEGLTLGDVIEDTNVNLNLEEMIYSEETKKLFDTILQKLSPREEHIIKLRFGIGVSETYTLEQIGNKLHLTKERVRQIEKDALEKLKNELQNNNFISE